MGSVNRSTCGGPKKTVHSDCVIDAHMHIMSGHCTPLPLLWKPSPGGFESSRGTSDLVSGLGWIMKQIDGLELANAKATVAAQEPDATDTGEGRTLQGCKTEVIGQVALLENQKTYGESTPVADSDTHRSFYEKIWAQVDGIARDDFIGLFTPMIAMPMDMEYAHIAGFEHQPIYYEAPGGDVRIAKRTYYFQSWQEMRLKLLPVEKEDIKKFPKWVKQKRAHEFVASSVPWSILPFYHYEPRRWYQPSRTELPTVQESPLLDYGCWDSPLNSIASRKQSGKPGIFIGMKMYPPLGYAPCDTRRLPHLSKYYLKCVEQDIPILTHCSLGGITTHEYDFYIQAENDSGQRASWSERLGNVAKDPEMAYFENACVHPHNWRKVLEMPGNTNLRLCLAHFGGTLWGEVGVQHPWISTIIELLRKYPNVYTDISCFDIEGNEKNFIAMLKDPNYQDIHKKILFGTDWYMTLMSKTLMKGIAKHYQEFVETFKHSLEKNGLQHLWPVMTLVNPVRYLGLDNGTLIDNIRGYFDDGVKMSSAQETSHKSNYKRMKALKDEVSKIRSQLNLEYGDKYLP